MIWNKKPTPDYYRWRKCFAYFPKRIGERWVWLEQYAYRNLDRPILSVGRTLEYWDEYTLKHDGYTALLKTTILTGMYGCACYSWHKPKPELRVVS